MEDFVSVPEYSPGLSLQSPKYLKDVGILPGWCPLLFSWRGSSSPEIYAD